MKIKINLRSSFYKQLIDSKANYCCNSLFNFTNNIGASQLANSTELRVLQGNLGKQ